MRITEGTWEAENGVVYITPKGHPNALIVYEANPIGMPTPDADRKAELEANARLMAAAPELYDELECLVAGLERYNRDPYQEELPNWTEAETLLLRINGCDE